MIKTIDLGPTILFQLLTFVVVFQYHVYIQPACTPRKQKETVVDH